MIYSRAEPANADIGLAVAMQSELLGSVGSSVFTTAIQNTLRLCADISEFMGFSRVDSRTSPQILMVKGEDNRATARADAYRDRFFRYDPVNRLFNEGTPSGVYVARVRSEEILHGDYRQVCYARPGFREKLTLASKDHGKWIVLNVYARERLRGFEPTEVESLSKFAQICLPIMALHCRLIGSCSRRTPLSVNDVEARLRNAFPELSNREVAVCARSLVGVTSEGIAIDLGIKQTSVLTYRRRAYERLNINSVHQLSNMLLQ